ncbi:MAG: hypothetical protein JW749_03600 [Sedimentisphaerales bacterium]|nr:hypothetical protein [Sedimentisphaerales bacterium]
MKPYKLFLLLLLLTSLLSAQNNSGGKAKKMSKPTAKQKNPMQKFKFLLGDWNLEYKIPKSSLSEAATGEAGTGAVTGTFKRALNDKYVFFDYSWSSSDVYGDGQAHGIFAWDDKAKVYRYWWFESSGNFAQATCNFIDDKTLFMNWHDTLLTQTFTKTGPDKVILRMNQSLGEDKSELVLEVILTRK